MKTDKLIYVYRSAKGFEKYSDYGQPEIVIYRLEECKGRTPFRDEIMTISAQIDKNCKTPYAIKFNIAENKLNLAMPIINAFSKAHKDYKGYGARGVLQIMHKLRVERFTHSAWVKSYTGSFSDYVPYAHRANIDLWVNAIKSGLKLSKAA